MCNKCENPIVEREYDGDGDAIFDMEKVAQTVAIINNDNLVEYIMEYEGGELCAECTIAFFQYLINTRMAWTLQGSYGRTAMGLIEVGYCKEAEEVKDNEQ